ncbi:DUF3761 domain-containing protein (plasmid) [Sphingomonas paeninsulae]|uniref:DUF3761 domain-containing protein n=1 Tax=Sphingomonas paeninsulae TaxID=2319844 RepID=A0A494THG6_SPHPE|nr:DUF3761 domain-containing protein [Sphingomonas paeninsulae]AYJ85286.1 DUF3761 domain-containing protein [Sphingomonas paeninsulae]
MKLILSLVAVLTVLAPISSVARVSHHHGQNSDRSSANAYYTARSGHRVHRPIKAANTPRGASTQCRDNSWSFS